MRHTTIDLAPGETAEVVLGPCSCPDGRVCADDDAFAKLCPRRLAAASAGRFLVLRGTADGQAYVRKLLAEIGAVVWTLDRAKAHRFPDRATAVWVQRCVVAHDGGCAAVVPDEPIAP